MTQASKISKHVLKEAYKAGFNYRLILLLDRVDTFVEVESNDEVQFERLVYIWWAKHRDELFRSNFKVYLYENGVIKEIKPNTI